MRLIRYKQADPWRALEDLHNEINKIFSTSPSVTKFPVMEEDSFSPSADVWEDKEAVHVEVDLPGFDEKDICLKVKGDNLVISAKKEESKEEQNLSDGQAEKHFYRRERFEGNFYRVVDLSCSIDAEKIKAVYKKGVLSITLPKKEQEKEREIKIESE